MAAQNAASNNEYIVPSFGQSNEGEADIDIFSSTFPTHPVYPLPDGYEDVDPTIKIAVDYLRPTRPANGVIQPHDQPPRWESMEGVYWTGYGDVTYGWEQSFLRHLRDRYNSTVYFIRIAKGGVPIEAFMPGGELYDGIEPLIRFAIDDIIARGKNPVILFARWGQGESNASEAPSTYLAKYESVIDYVRGLYPPYTTNIPFISRKLSLLQTILSTPDNINAAFDMSVSDLENCYTYSLEDMDTTPVVYQEPGYGAGQGIHWDGPTQLADGDYLFQFGLDNNLIP